MENSTSINKSKRGRKRLDLSNEERKERQRQTIKTYLASDKGKEALKRAQKKFESKESRKEYHKDYILRKRTVTTTE